MSSYFWPAFIPLLTAHLLGDFILQTDTDIARKHHPSVLLKHVLIVTAASFILLGIPSAWISVVVVFGSHFLIDYAKIRIGKDDLTAFSLDQLAHLVVLALLAGLMVVQPSDVLWSRVFGEAYFDALAFAAGGILVISVGAIIVGKAVDPFLLQMRASKKERPEHEIPRHGFEQGGRLIGQLERALIFLFVIANQLSAVGFLIAAKSILRIGEVKDRSHRMEAEYIIIGTLISFLWGLTAAFATRWVVNL